jgi:hypothetical protein
MKKINSFDRTNIRKINAEIEGTLAAIGQKYGLQISLGATSFSSSNYSTKLEVATVGDNGLASTKAAIDFDRYKGALGINVPLGHTFNRSGKTYTVIGCKPRSTKYPVLAECSDGKTYKFPVSLINNYAKS